MLRELAAVAADFRLEIASLEDRLRTSMEPVSESIRDVTGATAAIDLLVLLHDVASASETQFLQLAGLRPTLDPRAATLVTTQTSRVLDTLREALSVAKSLDLAPVASAVETLLESEYEMLRLDPALAAECDQAWTDVEDGRVRTFGSMSELRGVLDALAGQKH